MKKVIQIISLCLILLLSILFYLTCPWSNTHYAPGYNQEAFKKVKIGDMAEIVEQLLGKPIRIPKDGEGHAYWAYSRTFNTPEHMVRRCIIINESTGKVVRIDDKIVWDYMALLFSPSSQK